MGNSCSSGQKVTEPYFKESHQVKQEVESDESIEDVSLQKIDELLKLMQKHNLKRMTEEIKTDVHLFVLNNLLMSVQFVDNFERSADAAREFKREKESEITKILSQGPQDGQIIGDRKCYLIHGMGHILSQNYIYRPSDHFFDDLYASVQNRLDPMRSTFMCEGILPYEFTMTWDNMEVHPESQFDSLRSAPYESASGSPPNIRFCMEEPDEKNKVPKGYVRLRCVDLPISMRPPQALTYVPDSEHGYLYDYSEFNDKISEARSDSDGMPESDDSSESIHHNWMANLKKHVDQTQNPLVNNNLPTSSKATTKYDAAKRVQIEGATDYRRRDSGILPISKATKGQLMKQSALRDCQTEISVNVDAPTPKIEEEPQEFEFEELDENSNVTKYHLPRPLSDRWSKSLPRLPSQAPPNEGHYRIRDPNSSGYETGSQTSVASRSSSLVTLASEEVRDHWRSVEVKTIMDYPVKNRRKNSLAKLEPLASSCFMSVKYEIDSDDEGAQDESDTEDSSDEEGKKPPESVATETRTYLNSSQFSADYCSEFHYIAPRHGIPVEAVTQAVILGTTVRCAVPSRSESHHKPDDDGDDGSEDFFMLHTFTPSLISKSWPTSVSYKFNMRMKSKRDRDDTKQWPNFHQVDAMEEAGCSMLPLGYRSIEFFNAHQSLEWKVNFPIAETQLLNTFKHVHWRAYTFSALLYRAFLAPLGPQGLGLEHFRNIIYFMCHEDFVSWNDEQPGLHVKALLAKLYECLGKCKMPSFFIADHNLLKSIPPQNARLVQAHLSKIRENLLIYFIYAFRNLTNIRATDKYYPMPKMDRLYKILTVVKHEELLQIQTPGLVASEEDPNDEANKKEIRKKNKKKNKKIQMDLIANQDKYEGEFRTLFVNKHQKTDKTQEKYRKKRKQFEEKNRKEKAEKKKLDKSADIIPETERRKSIDLERMPVVPGKFSQFRLVLIIQFFIEHFLKMAKKANEFRAYSQTTMYILQVENLCQLLRDPKINSGVTSVDVEDIEDYEKETSHLRDVIGHDMRSYVTSRFPHLDSQNSNYPLVGEHYGRSSALFSGSAENWKFGKLPTPPESVEEELVEPERKDSQTKKKFEAPQLSKSLQSIPSTSRKPARKESIKFIDTPIIIRPKPYSRSNSREPVPPRQSLESTDL